MWCQQSKKYLAQKRAVLGLVSKLFLSPNSFSRFLLISSFWYCILWLTAMISNKFRWFHQSNKIFGPKKGHFRACLQIIFVSKFIFLTFTHYFFLILHIMTDSNDYSRFRCFQQSNKIFASKKGPLRLKFDQIGKSIDWSTSGVQVSLFHLLTSLYQFMAGPLLASLFFLGTGIFARRQQCGHVHK